MDQSRHSLVGLAELWEMKRHFQITFLKSRGLSIESKLLDLGCGVLRGGVPMIRYLDHGCYYGIEVRESVLDEGRVECLEAGCVNKRPVLMHVPDIAKLNIEMKFDFIWAYSVLFHMTDPILEDAFGFVKRHLADNGSFYANVNVSFEGSEWQGFPVVRRDLETYHAICSAYGLDMVDLGLLKDLGHMSNQGNQNNQKMIRMTLSG